MRWRWRRLQRLDAAAMAGTSFTLAEKMNSRWIRSCRDGGSSREDLDLFWFMVVLITRRMVEWSLRDGGSGTHGSWRRWRREWRKMVVARGAAVDGGGTGADSWWWREDGRTRALMDAWTKKMMERKWRCCVAVVLQFPVSFSGDRRGWRRRLLEDGRRGEN